MIREAQPAVAVNGAELLLAGHDPASPALAYGDDTMTYGALRERVARAAGAWRSHGLRPGGRVAVRLPDGPDWVVAWLGAIWAGGVAVGVNPRIPAREWQLIAEEARFDIVVAESVDGLAPPPAGRLLTLDDGRRSVAAARPVQPLRVGPQTPAFWAQSSGTSGRPKAVIHAHRIFDEIARVSTERLGITPQDRLFASSRLFFTYPLTNALLAGLRIGATVLLDPQWPTPESVAATVERLRPTVLFSVPSLYRSLLHERRAAGLRESGLRCCVSAGEALPPALRDAWQRDAGLPIVDGYGASETLVLVLTAMPGDDGLLPSPGVQLRALDPAAADAGGVTRLCVRVPALALGYHDRPAAQAESFRDGEFCPADLFARTPGGGWRFKGREDSLVKIRGRWVDLNELQERLAAGLSGIREAAVVRVADADGVDALALFFAADEAAVARAAFEERIATLPPHQRPAWVVAVDVLPRTATGKLLRRRLQELHQATE